MSKICPEFNFDEDGSQDIRRRNCGTVGTDALATQISVFHSVVIFMAFVARNLFIWTFQLDNYEIDFDRFMDN